MQARLYTWWYIEPLKLQGLIARLQFLHYSTPGGEGRGETGEGPPSSWLQQNTGADMPRPRSAVVSVQFTELIKKKQQRQGRCELTGEISS